MTEVTWLELKDKRDAGKLTPGSLYRITDYNCTTTQENTQSAGHQFDIVLLALSKNKLAEEGWAMEHPTDVYDVTFSDNVTKKCYFYKIDDSTCNIVDTNTLLGISGVGIPEFTEINEETKTALTDNYKSSDLNQSDVYYNYFQNSNLSAWKVWYCLNNDKSRFAWADDSVDDSIDESINVSGNYSGIFIRNSQLDTGTEYCWTKTEGDNTYNIYTSSPTPTSGSMYSKEPGGRHTKTDIINSYTPAHEGTGLPNGRGVIYRLIDEWNNDVGYDFKNIQFIRKLTDGQYDDSTGTDTWVYTFNLWYNNACEDASVKIGNKQCATYNIITSLLSEDNDIFVLSNSVCLGFVSNRGKYCTSKNVRIHNSEECTLGYAQDVSIDASVSIHIESGGIYCIMCSDSSYDVEGIYILNKKVLTEE